MNTEMKNEEGRRKKLGQRALAAMVLTFGLACLIGGAPVFATQHHTYVMSLYTNTIVAATGTSTNQNVTNGEPSVPSITAGSPYFYNPFAGLGFNVTVSYSVTNTIALNIQGNAIVGLNATSDGTNWPTQPVIYFTNALLSNATCVATFQVTASQASNYLAWRADMFGTTQTNQTVTINYVEISTDF
jgi:hypothetical protein